MIETLTQTITTMGSRDSDTAKDRRIKYLEKQLVDSHSQCTKLRTQLLEERRHSKHSEAFRKMLNQSGALFSQLHRRVKKLEGEKAKLLQDKQEMELSCERLRFELREHTTHTASLEQCLARLREQNEELIRRMASKNSEKYAVRLLTQGALGRSDGKPSKDLEACWQGEDHLPAALRGDPNTTAVELKASVERKLDHTLNCANASIFETLAFLNDNQRASGLHPREKASFVSQLHHHQEVLAQSAEELRDELRLVENEIVRAGLRERQYISTILSS